MSSSTRPLVWLPFDVELLDGAPTNLRYERVDPAEAVPDSVEEVEVYVAPYRLDAAVADVIPAMTRLAVVQTLTAGVDNVRASVPDGVTLCSGRGIHDTSTAELALTLVLASLRGIPEFVAARGRREWRPLWRPALADKHVLLVGYGAIGEAVERRLAPFEVTITRVARTPRPAGGSSPRVHGIGDLPGLLGSADVVILVLPLTEETRGLVDAEFLSAMKDGALLVNLARGPVVVTDDLVAELATGRLTAALDVVDPEPLPDRSPLWTVPGLLLSPHVGGPSSAMWPRAHRLVAAQLRRYAAGESLHNVTTGAY